MVQREREIPLVHSGEILLEDFLKPLGLTVNALTLALRVPSNRIYAIVEWERAISPDTALRLGRYFETGPEFWLNLQARYDLQKAKDEMAETIEREVQRAKTESREERRREHHLLPSRCADVLGVRQ